MKNTFHLLLALLLVSDVSAKDRAEDQASDGVFRSPSDTEFVNPIGEGADPWGVRDSKSDRYLWCSSVNNRAIAIHTSTNLTDLGARHIAWRAPETGPYDDEVWDTPNRIVILAGIAVFLSNP